MKYNLSNGGPAPESVTNKIFEASKTLTSYKIASIPDVDLSTVGTQTVGNLEVEIIDSTADYTAMLKDIFDFDVIKKFFAAHPDFKVLFDGLSGVTGPYGKAIFEQELGLTGATQNCEPSPDFNGGHPDPNLTYAHSLVEVVDKNNIPFGAASDGDGDRNMIYGANAFVSPGDSLAIIAHHANLIPYFQRNGVNGLARSMPTSGAVDLVAKKQGLDCYEVPTGWKFFCALFDAKKLSICGEESFGTGSDHIREKDGLWAIVAWLNIIAGLGVKNPDVVPSIKAIQKEFWGIYGRTFFTRYDYEDVDSEGANKVVGELQKLVADDKFVGSSIGGMSFFKIRSLSCTNTLQTAKSPRPATSPTPTSTALSPPTRVCTLASPPAAASSSVSPAPAPLAPPSVSTSSSTPATLRPTTWTPRTSSRPRSSSRPSCSSSRSTSAVMSLMSRHKGLVHV
jgi:phosphoglucomutase